MYLRLGLPQWQFDLDTSAFLYYYCSGVFSLLLMLVGAVPREITLLAAKGIFIFTDLTALPRAPIRLIISSIDSTYAVIPGKYFEVFEKDSCVVQILA